MRILLDKPILLLGREAECDIQFDSRKISRRHCCIAQVGDQLIVRDLGSTNGVRINGVRVAEGYLKTGDELTIGNQRYQVAGGEIQAQSRPAPRRRRLEKELAPPPVVQDVDDAALESCDEPIPLNEPGKAPRNGPPPIPRPPVDGASYPSIIPEELKLASSGDSLSSPPSAPPVA